MMLQPSASGWKIGIWQLLWSMCASRWPRLSSTSFHQINLQQAWPRNGTEVRPVIKEQLCSS